MEFPVSLCMGAVDLIVVCGNIFVLYVLISQPSMHTSTNFLVLSLTISDLLLGMLILPFAIIQEARKEWLFGDVGCRLWLSVDVWLSTASIYNLLAISFDRYMAVKQPIRYPSISSTKVTRLMVAAVWMFSLLLACILFALESINAEHKKECTPMHLPDSYVIFSATASFIAPAVIMVLLNVSIFWTVLTTSRSRCVNVTNGATMRVHRGRLDKDLERYEVKNTKKISEVSLNKRQSPEERIRPKLSVESTDSPIRSFFSHVLMVSLISTHRRAAVVSHIGYARVMHREHILREREKHSRLRFARISMRTELRVARTTGIVVAAFIICWFPFLTIYVLQVRDLCRVPNCVPEMAFTVAFWLGYANSAINPLLYAAFSRDFRAAFRKVLLIGSVNSK